MPFMQAVKIPLYPKQTEKPKVRGLKLIKMSAELKERRSTDKMQIILVFVFFFSLVGFNSRNKLNCPIEIFGRPIFCVLPTFEESQIYFYLKKKILVLLKVKEGREEIVQQKSGGCKHLQGIILPKRQACQGHKQTIVMIALLITNAVELPRFSAFLRTSRTCFSSP